MIIVFGSIQARLDTLNELRRLSLEHVTRSRTEPGCLRHSVHVDCEDPLRLFFYEEWADRAALDAHFEQAGSKTLMAAVRELSASSTRVRILPVVDRD